MKEYLQGFKNTKNSFSLLPGSARNLELNLSELKRKGNFAVNERRNHNDSKSN